MSGTSLFRTLLAKEDFKFSCAHFTVFSAAEAEPLHGHNYRVAVEVEGEALDDLDFLVEFGPVKKRIRELCDSLDESVLLAEQCSLYSVEDEGSSVTVRYSSRTYTLPSDEVRLLPLRNITVEGLARFLWTELSPTLEGTLVKRLSVQIGETPGQASLYVADVDAAS
ncbi:MAG: 6-carboxytetrahydropterin synthase [Acidobacteriota bacterium]